MSQSSARYQVAELLKKCTDEKLLRGASDRARDVAEKAYQLSNEHNLPAPWPQLAAYRLAHLLLREGANCDLDRVDALLSEASGGGNSRAEDCLGPMPRLYRLAVLHRMPDATEGMKQEVYNKAIKAIKDFRGTTEDVETRGPVQQPFFNLLELATYFLAKDYGPLEGLGTQIDDPWLIPTSWRLVSSRENLWDVRVGKHLALTELEEYGRREPSALLFLLERIGNDVRAEWRLGKSSGWVKAGDDENGLLILVHLLKSQGHDLGNMSLQSKIFGDGQDDDCFRQLKSRLNKRYERLTSRDARLWRESDRSGRTALAEDVVVYGAVDESLVRRRQN